MTNQEKLINILDGYKLGWNHSKILRLEFFLKNLEIEIGGIVSGSDEIIVKYKDTNFYFAVSPTELLNPTQKEWTIRFLISNKTVVKKVIKNHPLFEVDKNLKEYKELFF